VRAFPLLLASTGAAVAAIALGGCGSGEAVSSAIDPVAQAAEASELAPGFRASVSVLFTAPGSPELLSSPRHVPNELRQIAEVSRTLSGKVLGVPVKRILMGADPQQAASVDSLANPHSLDYFVEMAGELGAAPR